MKTTYESPKLEMMMILFERNILSGNGSTEGVTEEGDDILP